MTTPKVSTFRSGSSRFYLHPRTGDKVPGVTSVLNMLPKPFLKAWAAKEVASTAVREIEAVSALAKSDPDGAIDYLKRSPGRNTQAAADTGTAAHGVFETLALGGPMPRLTPDLEPFARHYVDFLETVQPEFLRLEDTVWSEQYAYAGSFDFYGRIQGEAVWGDNKTTRSGVHAEVALQLSAYSHADYLLDGETGEQILMPDDPDPRGVVVHVRPEGWGLYEVPIGDDVFDYFLALRKVFVWDTSISRGIPGKPLLKGAAK